MSDQVERYGWTAVARDPRQSVDVGNAKSSPIEHAGSESHWPSSDLVRKTRAWVRDELDDETFHHSMRVYHFGTVSGLGSAASTWRAYY